MINIRLFCKIFKLVQILGYLKLSDIFEESMEYYKFSTCKPIFTIFT